MGGTAHRQVLAARPVEVVVSALVTRLGPVGDLVPLVARRPQAVGGQLVLVGLGVVVGVAGRIGGERRAGLDGQGIGADVLRLEGDRGVERLGPLLQRLPCSPVDEIDVDRQSGAEGGLDRHPHVGGVVLSAQRGQHRGIHRLDADRKPGDTAVGVGLGLGSSPGHRGCTRWSPRRPVPAGRPRAPGRVDRRRPTSAFPHPRTRWSRAEDPVPPRGSGARRHPGSDRRGAAGRSRWRRRSSRTGADRRARGGTARTAPSDAYRWACGASRVATRRAHRT